jgi:hypothetical protein
MQSIKKLTHNLSVYDELFVHLSARAVRDSTDNLPSKGCTTSPPPSV